MSIPKVSIIVPIYNVESYLDRCMASLLNQTLDDIEIIMVDDGSPDRCPKICDNYATKDGRIKVIHKKNGGLGFARNSGLDIATGEYVAFLDSDDYVDVTMYEKLYAYTDDGQTDAVFCGLRRSFDDKYFINKSDVKQVTIMAGSDVQKLALDFIASALGDSEERHFEMSVWHSIYKRETIERIGLRFLSERDITSEDMPFQVAFFLQASKICFIPDVLYTYCMNNTTSLTKTFKLDKFIGTIKLFHHLQTLVADIDPGQVRTKRFFLGYMRSLSSQIVSLSIPIVERKALLEKQMEDEVWLEFTEYKTGGLPIYAQIFFMLQRRKCSWLLLLYAIVFNAVRERRFKSMCWKNNHNEIPQ